VNKTDRDLTLRLALLNLDGEVQPVGRALEVKAGELGQGELFIILDKDRLHAMKTKVVIGIYAGDHLLEKVSTSFVGPLTQAGT
jgi:hypothetical protein